MLIRLLKATADRRQPMAIHLSLRSRQLAQTRYMVLRVTGLSSPLQK
jgi:hypothetical protein